MIQINLLPWREQSRQLKKLFLLRRAIFFLSIVIVVFLIFHMYFSHIIRKQNVLKDFLDTQIAQEQALITTLQDKNKVKAGVEAKLRAIETVFKHNNNIIRFLNELVKIIPANISVEKIVHMGNKVLIGGTAASESDITAFVQTIGKSTLFSDPQLSSINVGSDANRKYFELTANQKG